MCISSRTTPPPRKKMSTQPPSWTRPPSRSSTSESRKSKSETWSYSETTRPSPKRGTASQICQRKMSRARDNTPTKAILRLWISSPGIVTSKVEWSRGTLRKGWSAQALTRGTEKGCLLRPPKQKLPSYLIWEVCWATPRWLESINSLKDSNSTNLRTDIHFPKLRIIIIITAWGGIDQMIRTRKRKRRKRPINT